MIIKIYSMYKSNSFFFLDKNVSLMICHKKCVKGNRKCLKVNGMKVRFYSYRDKI